MCVKYRPVTGLRTGYQNLLESISDLPLALLHEAVRIRFLRFVVHNCPAITTCGRWSIRDTRVISRYLKNIPTYGPMGLDFMSSDDHFLEKVQFSVEGTFHVSSAVNRRIVRIWVSGNPHAHVQHQRDSPKVNVFCVIFSQKVYGPFFFAEETITGMTYLDMLQTVANAIVAKYTDVHIPARRKSRPLSLWGSSVPEHRVTRTLDRACVWKWPTSDVMAPKVPWHYSLWLFFYGDMSKTRYKSHLQTFCIQ